MRKRCAHTKSGAAAVARSVLVYLIVYVSRVVELETSMLDGSWSRTITMLLMLWPLPCSDWQRPNRDRKCKNVLSCIDDRNFNPFVTRSGRASARKIKSDVLQPWVRQNLTVL
jgi:hypothetical protein